MGVGIIPGPIPVTNNGVGGAFARPNLTPWSYESMAASLAAMAFAAPASAANPTASKAWYFPVSIGQAMTCDRLFIVNGAAVSGNIDLAVYDVNFVRLVSTGSVAQAGTSATQVVDVANTALIAGLYYIAFAIDNTTGTFIGTIATSVTAYVAAAVGMAMQLTAFPLPATATPVTIPGAGAAPIPIFGIASRAFV